MSEQISSNKKIAKNTILLYTRMLVTMLVSLYTSRVILRVLGVSDFGVYNVVGGFVAMLSYLKTAFVGGTQRFMSFTLGQKDFAKLKSVFNNSIIIFILLFTLTLLIAETFGLWFVNNKLAIDGGRICAANWVYQCSLISLGFTLMTVSYNASIIAHEHMRVYAYVSIIETFLKLGIVFLLVWSPYDKLIFYSILHLLISISIFVFYRFYCRKMFIECVFHTRFDKNLFKEMFSYSWWHLIGNLGFTFKDQFSNIIMNMFLGTTINAARGIATQVNAAIMSFSNSLVLSITPPITKQYAAGNYKKSRSLVYSGSRFSTYFIALLGIPIILNIDFVLDIWLYEVPPFTSELTIVTIISSMFYAMSQTTSAAIQATGRIKAFQIGIAIIMLLELPFAYLALYKGLLPYWALMPAIFTNIIGFFYRTFLLSKSESEYTVGSFLRTVFLRCVIVIGICYIVGYFINSLFPVNFVSFIASSILVAISSSIIILLLGINTNERTLIINYVKMILRKNS